MLPGPARELRPLFTNGVVPFLGQTVPVPEPFVCRTLRTAGLGESVVQERIGESLRGLVSAGLEVGYCARPGQVDVRLAATGESAAQRVAEAEAAVRGQLGPGIFGIDDEELEEVVIRLLAERRQTLAVAESCTGGCLADRLTNVPGASAVLRAGLVAYSNEAKQAVLAVPAETLDRHGAVSEAVASAMAEGARRVGRSDFALATTGIAGPSGGTPGKPVGTVFIAVTSSHGTEVKKMFNAWDRRTFKEVTVRQALDLLRLRLLRS
jgi:nicotinamide-nucleotide amidase